MKSNIIRSICFLSIALILLSINESPGQKIRPPVKIGESNKNILNKNSLLYGDIDNNGTITTYDAFNALRMSVGTTTSLYAPTFPYTLQEFGVGDVDGNHILGTILGQYAVSTYDAFLILRRSVGYADPFPVEIVSAAPDIPALSAPANAAAHIATTPTFVWSPSSTAVSYTLQVSTSSSFLSYVYNQSGLTTTSQAVSGLSSSTQYYWRVNATNSFGSSGWSTPAWSFTTVGLAPSVPVLASPVNNSINISTSPMFGWNVSPTATSYTLQVSTDNSFSSFVYNQSGLSNTFQQISGLNNSTLYYWRVSAANSFETSAFSSSWSFTTISTTPAPVMPTLASPSNSAVGISTFPTLSWNNSATATSYTLQVSTSSSFTNYVFNQSGLTGTSQALIGLNNLTQYYWRVSASNGSGTSGWQTPAWTFTTMSGNGPCPGTPTLVYSGKTYNTVQIGNQCWLKENLDVGAMILGAYDQMNNGTLEKYCYDNNPSNCLAYGGLYQWAEAVQYHNGATNTTSANPVLTGNIQGICPTGWHLPSKAELETLNSAANGACNALQAVGQGTGTNTTQFSALLGGFRNNDSYFNYLGNNTYFWSTGEAAAFSTFSLALKSESANTSFLEGNKVYGYSARCIKNDENAGMIPTVPDLLMPADNAVIASLSPTCSWNVSTAATSYTLQVSTNSSFSSFIYNQSGLTATSQAVTGLNNLAQYFWRVNASNSYGTSGWSNVRNFTISGLPIPCPEAPTITDTREGKVKVYNTVKIGDQCWLKENLDVGAMINGNVEPVNNGVIEKYCYNNDLANCATYGGLYQWAEAVQYKNGATDTTSASPAISGNVQGICFPGWHIPSATEFQTLMTAVNNDGNSLKALSQGLGAGAGTNTSGFSTLIVGTGDHSTAGFYNFGVSTYFWSASETDLSTVRYLGMNSDSSTIVLYNNSKRNYISVRCIKD